MRGGWLNKALAAMTVLTAMTSGLNAQCGNGGCPPPAMELPKCGATDWIVKGELLWWAPLQTDFNYAEVGTVEPNTGFSSAATMEYLDSRIAEAKYNLGWAATFGYTAEPWLLTARYIQVDSQRNSTTLRGDNDALIVPFFPGLGGQVTAFDRAHSTLRATYHDATLFYGYQAHSMNCSKRWWGIRTSATYFRDRFRVQATGQQEQNQVVKDISGDFVLENTIVGLGLGPQIQMDLDLRCGFSLWGWFSAMVGRRYTRTRVETRSAIVNDQGLFGETYEDTRFPVRFETRPCNLCDVRGALALNYTKSCGGCSFIGQLGYEFHTYDFRYGGPMASIAIGW